MMERFCPVGFGRFALMAIFANQLALVLCALAGAKVTPVLAIIGATAFGYWDFFLLPRATASIPDRESRIAEETRQVRRASYLFGMPLLWFAVPSCVKGSAHALSMWKMLDIFYLGEVFGVFLLLGRRGFQHLAVTTDSRPKDS